MVEIIYSPSEGKRAREAARQRDMKQLEFAEMYFDHDLFQIELSSGYGLIEDLRHSAVPVEPTFLKIMGDPSSTPVRRASACVLLCWLGDTEAPRFLVDILAGKDVALRSELLTLLADFLARPEWWPSEAAPHLLAALESDDPQVRDQALRICSVFEVPGRLDVMREMLKSPELGLRQRQDILADFVRNAPDPSVFAQISELAKLDDPGFRVLYALSETMDELPPDQVESSMNIYRICAATHDRTEATRFLIEHAREEDLAWLERRLLEINDHVQRGEILKALARLKGSEVLPRLREELNRPKEDRAVFADILEALEKAAAGTRDEALFNEIYEIFEQLPSYMSTTSAIQMAKTVRSVQVPHSREKICSVLARTNAANRADFLLDLAGVTPEAIEERLIRCGLIAKRYSETPEHERRGPHKMKLTKSPAPCVLIVYLLYQAGALHGFDTESSIPVRHNRLIRDLAGISQGQFTPEALLTTETDDESDYTVQFIFRGALYRFVARRYNDWYDVEAVINAMNTAMDSAHEPERFHVLDLADQYAFVVFATPEAMDCAAEQLGLATRDTPDRDRLVKAFEEKHLRLIPE